MPSGGSAVTNRPPVSSHCATPTQAIWCDSGDSDSRTVSVPRFQSATRSRAFASKVLSECMTHFGVPVVPDVNARYETLSGSVHGGVWLVAGAGKAFGVYTTLRLLIRTSAASKAGLAGSVPQLGSVSNARSGRVVRRSANSAHVEGLWTEG